MFENFMRKKFFEGNLFLQKDNTITPVKRESTLLGLVRAVNENAEIEYIDGIMTVKVVRELWVRI